MPHYMYQAQDQAGQPVSGECDAAGLSEAVERLEAQGLLVVSIVLAEAQLEPASDPAEAEGQRVAFYRSLDEKLARRDDYLPPLIALAGELPSAATRREFQKVIQILQTATSAQQVVASPAAAIILPLLSGGVDSRSSSDGLQEWLASVTRSIENRQRWRRMMVYPTVVVCVALLLSIGMSLFVIPIFRSMYTEFGLVLPSLTLAMLWVAEQLSTRLPRTVVVVALLMAACWAVVRTWRHFGLANRLLGPVVAGSTSNLLAMSSLTRVLAEALHLGAPLPVALRVAGQSCRHVYYRQAVEALALQVGQTTARYQHTKTIARLPPTVLFALLGDGQTRPHINLLRELANVYGQRTLARMDWGLTTLPAAAMIGVGVVVALVVVSLFAPLVMMVSSLS